MEHKEYKRIVAGAKTALLCVHGIVGTPHHFDAFVSLVPKDISVYNLLLDGHGKGVTEFARTSMKQWEAQVEAAIETLLSTHENIYIAAHSMGTLLAIEQAVKNKKIAKLFLLAVPLTLFLKPAVFSNSLKVYCNKIDPGDERAMAAKNGYGIEQDKNIFKYMGWFPRYLELFSKIRHTRKILPLLDTPCRAYQSGKDEMVSKKSISYLRQNACIAVVELEKSGHFYYEKDDKALLLQEFKEFING